MDERMEKLAEIEPGDSNEVCLAKTVLAIDKAALHGTVDDIVDLTAEAVIYADEVLNARD